jgi:hypothetical protein
MHTTSPRSSTAALNLHVRLGGLADIRSSEQSQKLVPGADMSAPKAADRRIDGEDVHKCDF